MMVLGLNSKTGNAMTVIGSTLFTWARLSGFVVGSFDKDNNPQEIIDIFYTIIFWTALVFRMRRSCHFLRLPKKSPKKQDFA